MSFYFLPHVIVVLVLTALIAVLVINPGWLWHPLGQCSGTSAEQTRCKSYNLWSGSISDISEITLIGGLLIAGWRIRKHSECDVESPKNCHKVGHPVAGTGHKACHEHHPHAAERNTGITAETIRKHHEESAAQ